MAQAPLGRMETAWGGETEQQGLRVDIGAVVSSTGTSVS